MIPTQFFSILKGGDSSNIPWLTPNYWITEDPAYQWDPIGIQWVVPFGGVYSLVASGSDPTPDWQVGFRPTTITVKYTSTLAGIVNPASIAFVLQLQTNFQGAVITSLPTTPGSHTVSSSIDWDDNSLDILLLYTDTATATSGTLNITSILFS